MFCRLPDCTWSVGSSIIEDPGVGNSCQSLRVIIDMRACEPWHVYMDMLAFEIMKVCVHILLGDQGTTIFSL